MSKKIMLLALAVVSAAFFALPAIASAQEIHLEPGATGETFSVTGAGGELRAEGEPTVTCSGTEATENTAPRQQGKRPLNSPGVT